MPKLFAQGGRIDATFSISPVSASRFDVFFESRSGTMGTAAARNTQYEEGLELLLTRLFQANVTIESIALSPGNKNQLTELTVPDLPFPWSRTIDESAHELRVRLGRVQASTNRAEGAKGRGNHTKRLRLACSVANAVNRQELERILSGAGAATERLATIVAELERLAGSYRLGDFQKIRNQRSAKRGADRTSRIFGTVQPGSYGPYVHHKGGRSEMQFNLAIEPDGEQLRFGVAFSFEPSRSMPWKALEETLIPRVARFNELIRLDHEAFADLRMWYELKNVRSGPDELPGSIAHERIAPGVFIFFGSRQNLSDLDLHAVLSTFDRLLPVYLYVEDARVGSAPAAEASVPFSFDPKPWKDRVSQTVVRSAQKLLDVSLRHNEMQKALHRALVGRFGTESVDYEVECRSDTRADVVVRNNGEYWFYEIKTAGTPRHCIREAVGQLLEYAYWPGAPPVARLIVVGAQPLDAGSRSYLAALQSRFHLPIDYEQVSCELSEAAHVA